jgi:hypothetical protein
MDATANASSAGQIICHGTKSNKDEANVPRAIHLGLTNLRDDTGPQTSLAADGAALR